MAGAILGGADEEQTAQIEKAASAIGLAFQIQDDILDVTSTSQELGKPVHSDEKNNKVTYVTLFGVEKASEQVQKLSEQAEAVLEGLSSKNKFLTALVMEMASRRNERGIQRMLEKINKPNDIHKIALADFPQLAEEIRQFLIESVSQTGGHLASNLGAVELTLALHNVLELPQDKIVWDVGHQAYTHKILTGRKEGFKKLRKEGGMSGFPKRSESDCDAFDAGHSSNSISAGLGYVRARDLLGQNYRVVSVIGDGALTGGMAYEALNNAAELKTNFIIVLNDNNMSISKNVGGISSYLSALRTAESYTGMKINVTKNLKKIPRVGTALVDTMRKTKSSIKQLIIPGMLFENMGITYLGRWTDTICAR